MPALRRPMPRPVPLPPMKIAVAAQNKPMPVPVKPSVSKTPLRPMLRRPMLAPINKGASAVPLRPLLRRPMPVRPQAAPAGFAATCTGMPLPPEAKGTVKGLQTFLNQRGLGPLPVDGICGHTTFLAWEKYKLAVKQMGTNQTQPSNLPSGPTTKPPVVIALPAPTATAPLPTPPAQPVPIWKQPIFIAAAAIIVVLFLTRRK